MQNKLFFSAAEFEPHFSSGTWTLTKTSNIVSWDRTAADATPVVSLLVPKYNMGPHVQDAPKAIKMLYSVATAALDAAPTVVVDKLTLNQTTFVVSRAEVTQTKTVAGSDTTGTAAGTYALIATIADADLVKLAENERLQIQGTFDCAGGTVLKIFGLEVQYA